ncbi:site-specific integrase [Nocardioides caricicola]|uniref:Tyrosine-type recombinase/integrase n=1 Tax=Nocardioides caricicola TaxID=634770 RepID=A0ABW0N4M7_9ACTN
MARPEVTYESVERGVQKVIRTYDDGRVVTKFRIKYADARGKVQFKTVDSHRVKDARDALIEAKASVMKGQHVSPRDASARFIDVAREWLEVKQPDLKPRTYESYEWTVDKKLVPLHDVRMKNLDYRAVSTFRANLSKPKVNGDRPAPSSVKRTMLVPHGICEHARKRKLILENPCADLDKVKARKPQKKMPSTEQVEALISRLSLPTPPRQDSWGRMLKERPADRRWALLVETAAYTGLRAGELAGLQARDIRGDQLSVVRTVIDLPGKYEAGGGLRLDTPKSEASARTIKIHDQILERRLRKHCANLKPRDFVFGDHDDEGKPRPLNHGNFYKRVIKPAADELHIEMTFHGLRHHCASFLIDLGMSPVDVAAYLGHESAAFTLRTYAHLFKEASRDYSKEFSKRRAAARGEEVSDNVVQLRRSGKRKPF